MHFLSTRLFYYTYVPCTSILQFYGLDVVFKNTLVMSFKDQKFSKEKLSGATSFKS